MNFESVDQALEKLRKLEKTNAAYIHALGVMEIDEATVAPSDSWEGRGTTMGVLSEAMYDLIADPKNGELLAYLKDHQEELDQQARREVEIMDRNYQRMNRIPAEEYVAYNVLLNDAQVHWKKAKAADDFQIFKPYLEQIVAYNRKFAGYYDPNLLPYDALLNEYEEGMTMEVLDAFFDRLRETIVPLLTKIREKGKLPSRLAGKHYPVDVQQKLSDYLMEIMGLDRSHCVIAESEHPFTSGFNNKDVRITTRYDEDSFVPSMYSVIHEGGHAIYELGNDSRYNYTALYGGASMGMHESQSRFYENLVGRSEAFIHYVFPKIKELFPEQMAGVTADDFYREVNRVEPSLIRIDADELTYSLHIMIRYEIEKQLIAGTLNVDGVPAAWNRLYQDYLGVDVPGDAQGCLQDIHWSIGNIGYFPSYALGSAYGAQMIHAMQQEMGDVYANVAKGDISHITAWLQEHIHQYGMLKKPGQLFCDACGTFDATYFTDYLKEKYSKLYNL
ncbi:MAG: carboxypeptidase M32 [Faecousia sp.]